SPLHGGAPASAVWAGDHRRLASVDPDHARGIDAPWPRRRAVRHRPTAVRGSVRRIHRHSQIAGGDDRRRFERRRRGRTESTTRVRGPHDGADRPMITYLLALAFLAPKTDLSGAWILNTARSHSSQPLPAGRVLIITRSGNGYVLRQVDGTDTTTFTISLSGSAP